MQVSSIRKTSVALLGWVVVFAAGPTSAKTVAECQKEYTAKKNANASGQTQKNFVATCRAGGASAPTSASAPAAAPSTGAAPQDTDKLREAAQNPIASLISEHEL